ncbi:hypothetical protein [Actinotalea sp. JY-7876]|uniref:hypothetical protein n=1 Tax=Actinotalea sp. JY-7876 TaxID=2758442 RepID=UPI0015F7767C|nr:hypothetical protein [Actinotalea sp. JY-7876]
MGDEVELISDGAGLAVVGESSAVERFLTSQGLAASRDLVPQALRRSAGTAGATLQAGGAIAAESGRWLKMTEASARKVKELGGLMPTDMKGISHAIIGPRGDIKSWIQISGAPGQAVATFTNPAALASIGTFMAQQQMQQSIDEIKEYLAQIDEKVDDILRAQKDAVVADMVGVDLMVEEAMTVRDQVGRVSEVTWSKVQAGAATIARTQAYALRQLDALAEKLERKTDMGDLIKATNEAEAKVHEWLAMVARCFQLQESLGVLELDRVQDGSPEELDRHRLGLGAARQNRIDVIARTTARLIDRMNDAARWANGKVLLNPFESPAVVRSGNRVVTAVVDFQAVVGIESTRQAADARRWLAAVVDTRDATLSKAQTVKDKALGSGADGVVRASEATGKFFNGIAERARRQRGAAAEPE